MRPLKLVFHPKETCFPTHCFRTTSDGANYAAETYQFVYKENPAIGICGLFPRWECLGYHFKDIERITYFYETRNMNRTLVRVLVSAHSNEHQYIPVHTSEDPITVYVAKGSHAFYGNAGIQWRIMGFANDLCGNGRVQVFTDADVQELTEPTSTEFGFTVNPEILPPIANVRTRWQRFWLPFT